MEKRIKYLVLGLKVELFIGVLISGFISMTVGTMATASPSSDFFDFLLASSLTFLAFSSVLVIIPFYSIKEVHAFPEKGTLVLNFIYVILFFILSFYLFPFTIWNLYHLIKLREEKLIQ